MQLDARICYRAIRSRDPRFDGRFFTAVKSTGIYCRPICPARTPRESNCRFYACAAAAEEAGFRPCRRCRPEALPGTPAWRQTSAMVTRALRLIEDGALDRHGVSCLAGRLGIGDRHLRRAFAEQLGASPLAIAQTRRVHFAKRLIEQTTLPMARIADAAGFRTVRRFNAAVRRSFDRTPTEIRASIADRVVDDGRSLRLRLAYRPPLDWPALLAWLRPRAIPGVESVEHGVYRRTIAVGPFRGRITVERADDSALRLQLPAQAAPVLLEIVDRVRRLFDLDADPAAILEPLGEDAALRAATRRHPGLRIPGCWDRFELAVRAVLGQQVSVAAATTLAGRLAERYGEALAVDDSTMPHRLFPTAERLANAELAALGMPQSRARTVRNLVRAVLDDQPVLDVAPDLETAIDRLTRLDGFGDWTAQYIALRALREPDAFPAGDLGLRKAMTDADGNVPSIAALRARAEAWRPWRGYAAMLLWRTL